MLSSRLLDMTLHVNFGPLNVSVTDPGAPANALLVNIEDSDGDVILLELPDLLKIAKMLERYA